MPVSDAVLRRLHELISRVADMKSQIERGPKQIQAALSQLQAAKDAVSQCKDAVKQKKMEADRKQLLQREREAKLFEWQGKLNGAKNDREFQAVKDQLAADNQANNVLSDEILEVLETIDGLQVRLKDVESKLATAESDTAKTETRTRERLISLGGDLARAESELTAAEADIPGDFFDTYRRIVDSRGPEAMAPLDEKSCGGCNTGLTLRAIDQLRLGNPITCSSCGRLIYRPES